MKGSGVSFEHVVSATPEVELLVGELDALLWALYPPESSHGLPVASIFADPAVHFVIAREADGEAAGCGAVKVKGDESGELKRVFVRAAHRRKGIAQQLLAHLEEWARGQGLKELLLETGDAQTAAIELYKRTGYGECAPFEPYSSMAPNRTCSSVFMSKRL